MQDRIREILERIKSSHQRILGDNLLGIYVHGSIAFDCFRWDTGDIDYLVVVHEPPPLADKAGLVEALLDIDRDAPPKGLEMSVVLERHCRDFIYPTPFELHFSNRHKERARTDPTGYCQGMQGTDKDLAAHMTVTRAVGLVLCGPAIDSVFAPVPRADFLDSVGSDIRDAAEKIGDNPVYAILNLCRTLAYTRDGLILSKEQGGEWGIRNLPAEFAPLLRKAIDQYRGMDAVWTDADRDDMRCFVKLLHSYSAC